MKFEVIVGNPPYQDKNKSIYNLFIDYSMLLCNRIVMITKNNWLQGDRLRPTRDRMVKFGIKYIKNYPIRKEIFTDANVNACIVYLFKLCNSTNYIEVIDGETVENIIVDKARFNGIFGDRLKNSIIEKVTSDIYFEEFDLPKNARLFSIASNGNVMHSTYTEDCITYTDTRQSDNDVEVVFMDGSHSVYSKFTTYDQIPRGKEFIGKYKVICGSKAQSNSAVLPTILILKPGQIMTNSYNIIGLADDEIVANRIYRYAKTRFFRILTRFGISGDRVGFGIGCTRYVPLFNFNNTDIIDWDKSVDNIDEQLFNRYSLSKDEIDYIIKLIEVVR